MCQSIYFSWWEAFPAKGTVSTCLYKVTEWKCTRQRVRVLTSCTAVKFGAEISDEMCLVHNNQFRW